MKIQLNIPLLGLTTLFVILKLANIIEWSWWWVLAPLWIPFSIWFLAVLLMVLLLGVDTYNKIINRR
ncbi:hypothetical protein [Intestinibacter sp.]|uniref:hypothetical protein n=1 Tax=Intestinibacter sp. TaxID=1965304 RepID=UPI003F143D0F